MSFSDVHVAGMGFDRSAKRRIVGRLYGRGRHETFAFESRTGQNGTFCGSAGRRFGIQATHGRPGVDTATDSPANYVRTAEPACEDFGVPTVAETLDRALAYRRAGQPREAESLYRQVLEGEPANFAACCGLGAAMRAQGKLPEAIACLERALRVNPESAEARLDLAVVLAESRRFDESVAELEQALRILPRSDEIDVALRPSLAMQLDSLAVQLTQERKLEMAAACCRKAVEFAPEQPSYLGNLANVMTQQGKLDEAVACYRHVLKLDDRIAATYVGLGGIAMHRKQFAEAAAHFRRALELNPQLVEFHHYLGTALTEQGLYSEAEASFRRLLESQPNHVEACSNLGVALANQQKLSEAIDWLRRAVQLQPDHAAACNNLGCALAAVDRSVEAIESFRHALAARPDFAEAHSNLGSSLQFQGLPDEALASYDRAIELKPDFAEAHHNRSFIWLSQGDFARGWPEHEWRLKCPDQNLPRIRGPRWDGSRLDGRTILLYAEQGLGDTMQFIRYVALVRRLGGRVLVVVPPALVPLLRQSGIENLFSVWTQVPAFDVHAPLLSMPGIFGTTLESIPADVPYLHADPSLVERWRPAVEWFAGFRVGINWQGRPTFRFDRYRSIPLVEFAPLAKVAGVQLISLQKIRGMEQIGALNGRFDVAVLAGQAATGPDALMDTAATMRNLDLVITSDTATAHLAGALGVPVWVAMPFVPDWRWLFDRDDCPWYPTMRLFRQTRRGDWNGVFERIAAELQSMLEANVQPR
jgi:tetratricopeptide (TPR) repeat protein